jgi:carbonyl reductase 1
MRRAVVTGGNRGLGFETCRQLAERGVEVLLGARDRRLGEQSIEALRRAGLSNVRALDLDIADPQRVADAAAAAGPIDILVANAGTTMRGFDERVARETIDVNYFGTARVIDAFLPQLREPGAIVVVSSGMGELSVVSEPLRAQFLAPDLDRAKVDALMNAFVRSVGAKTLSKEGWPSNAYSVSKVGVNALVRVIDRELEAAGRRIAINAVCPGWVRTRMGGSGAPLDVSEGADTIVWAAMFEGGRPSGQWFRERARIDW